VKALSSNSSITKKRRIYNKINLENHINISPFPSSFFSCPRLFHLATSPSSLSSQIYLVGSLSMPWISSKVDAQLNGYKIHRSTLCETIYKSVSTAVSL
jgi:hypothetical protein